MATPPTFIERAMSLPPGTCMELDEPSRQDPQASMRQAMALPAAFIKPAKAHPAREFCIKLSMSSIEGRPLSVSLARYDERDNPLIGCSLGFLALSGLARPAVLGRNCRFLNAGLAMPLRERLRTCIREGTPFVGVLDNVRYLGGMQNETFQNLLHLAVIVAGSRSYIIGLQADVTGLDLDLADDSYDAGRLQNMFDSVFSAGVNAWIHLQEGIFHCAPLYLHIRQGWQGDDEIFIEEDSERTTSLFSTDPDRMFHTDPDRSVVLAPRFPQAESEDNLKWRFLVLENGREPIEQPPAQGPPGLSLTGSADSDIRSQSRAYASEAGCPEASSSGAKAEEHVFGSSSMKNQLRTLNAEDPASVMSARGISKLGMTSSSTLRKHFSNYGHVKDVYVPFVHKKRSKEPRSAGRGFIVMDSPQLVLQILAQGSEHVVEGVKVLLERFSAKESQDESNPNDHAG